MAQENNFSQPIASKTVTGGGKAYFFDVKESKKGNKYLQITESRRQANGQSIRNRLFIFPEQVEGFKGALDEVAKEL